MIQNSPRWSSWFYKSPRPGILFLSQTCSSLALALSAIINCICALFLPQTWCGMQGIQKIILACKVFNRSSWGHHDVVKCVEILSSVVIVGVNGCCYKDKMLFQKRGMTGCRDGSVRQKNMKSRVSTYVLSRALWDWRCFGAVTHTWLSHAYFT